MAKKLKNPGKKAKKSAVYKVEKPSTATKKQKKIPLAKGETFPPQRGRKKVTRYKKKSDA